MNSYQQYYNYEMNINNQQYNNQINNTSFENDAYIGFIRGNMFDSLYDQYKNYTPVELQPTDERNYALMMIQMYAFAAHDISLYLDINPNDSKAIQLRTQYENIAKQLKNEYEFKYGPITKYSNTLEQTPWVWNNNPWPWEGNK